MIRLSVDIGGTFTDTVLDVDGHLFTSKVLTTPAQPERGALSGIEAALADAGVAVADIGVFIHGTTLATNAVIERKGARTAMITTEGFRDIVDSAYESRHNQYDLMISKTRPLVERNLRFTVAERIDRDGKVVRPLDEASVAPLARLLEEREIESVAVCFLQSYRNPAHEMRVRELLLRHLPGLSVSLSSVVCPEIREYERFTTATVNAYVQPIMARYLTRLESLLRQRGLGAPIFLVTSAGGLMSLRQAVDFPVRLLESGPAGGVVLASRIAAECSVGEAISFDMGGTTAKFALIKDSRPVTSRTFEVDRQDSYIKGSGLPIRIPVIELVEIGAGGGSIAHMDKLGRVATGPESAAAEPGPAAYGRGSMRPTVTDADIVLGRIDAERFAGGQIRLDVAAAREALDRDIAGPMSLTTELAAFAVSDVVDEMMANAGRRYAAERGKNLETHSMIAFGGAAPLHASRLARKLGVREVIVPKGAGVGSAIGFLGAPVSFEAVKTHFMRLDRFDETVANALLDEMARDAHAFVDIHVGGGAVVERRSAMMRYVGQGHELSVLLPDRPLEAADVDALRASFERIYSAANFVAIPDAPIEVIDWSVTVGAEPAAVSPIDQTPARSPAKPFAVASVFDVDSNRTEEVPTYWRPDLVPGSALAGPALVTESHTTTFVDRGYVAEVLANGYLRLQRIEPAPGDQP